MSALPVFIPTYIEPIVCRLCTKRVCSKMEKGRLINENSDGSEIDTNKIRMSEVKIGDCEIRATKLKEA